MTLVKELSLFILIGILITFAAYLLESSFILTYLKENIIGLLLTLLAINTATSGLIASKIQDITIQYADMDFSKTLSEMKKSLTEQIILITVAFLTILVVDSTVLSFLYKDQICSSILVTVISYAVYLLWDTGRAVFIIIEEINKLKK